MGFIEKTSKSDRCIPCRLKRRRIIDNEAVRKKRFELKASKYKAQKLRPLKNKIERLKRKVRILFGFE